MTNRIPTSQPDSQCVFTAINWVTYSLTVTVRMQNGATPVGELATSPETAAREMDKGILYEIGTPLKTLSSFYNHDYDVNNLYSYDVNSLVVAAIRTQGSIITMVVEQYS